MLSILAVCTPVAPSSNGHKAYASILLELRRKGHDVRALSLDYGATFDDMRLVFAEQPSLSEEFPVPYLRRDQNLEFLRRDPIAMYPETVFGNPLGLPKVIRYMGNREGVLTGLPMGRGADDFIISHSKRLCPNANAILYFSHIDGAFWKYRSEPMASRGLDCTYVGKGQTFGKCQVVPDTLLIERDRPRGSAQLSLLLARTRLLFTWDSWSSAVPEAVMCGAVPVICRYGPFSKEDLDGVEIGPIPRLDAPFDLLDHGSPLRVLRELDWARFQRERDAMVDRMVGLENSWSARVHSLADGLVQYFS